MGEKNKKQIVPLALLNLTNSDGNPELNFVFALIIAPRIEFWAFTERAFSIPRIDHKSK